MLSPVLLPKRTQKTGLQHSQRHLESKTQLFNIILSLQGFLRLLLVTSPAIIVPGGAEDKTWGRLSAK